VAVHRRRIPSTDPRLKRHVQHDDRSLAYAAPVLPRAALQAQHWPRRCAVLDQLRLGACVGNAFAGWVGTDNAVRQGRADVTEDTALDLYRRATRLDEFDGQWEPDDTGSSGLGGAKALQQAGYAGSYTHAFALAALATALQTGPALIGIAWYQSMYDPAPNGRIGVDTRSALAGGHELIVDTYEPVGGPDDRYWITNSWGASWAQRGRAYFTGNDLAILLADDGDVTVPTALTAPGPSPAPVDADQAFAAALHPWVATHHIGANGRTATAAKTWLAAKGL
jgi:hypothetical protein